MIRYDYVYRLLVADTLKEAKDLAHHTGPRQVGVFTRDDVIVYSIQPNGEAHLTHHPDSWGYPAWYANDPAESDENTILASASEWQMERFDRAAKAAGHPSGRSAANELNLWDSTVAEAIKVAGCTEEAT